MLKIKDNVDFKKLKEYGFEMNIEHSRYVKENKRKIDNLRLVNKRLNNIINKKEQFLGDNIKRLEREVVKRDNIINEFDKWLDEESEKTILSTGHLTCLMMCKNKLQELKGSVRSENMEISNN